MKKILLVLIITLTITLIGCNNAITTTDTTTTTTTITTTTTTETTTTETTTTETTTITTAVEDPYLSISISVGWGGLIQRQYLLYLPDGIEAGAPLVLMLNKFYESNALEMVEMSGMNDVADINKFAVVYPVIDIGWGDGTDDLADTSVEIGFLRALIDFLQEEYSLSVENTFAAGYAVYGGFFVYELTYRTEGLFKAIASVGGGMSYGMMDNLDNPEKISILHIHGLDDPSIPPEDEDMCISLNEPCISEIIYNWSLIDELEILSETDPNENLHVLTYTSASNDYIVQYYQIAGFGLGWPQDNEMFEDEDNLYDASQIIWEFFEALID